jgi:hypothetical protein
LPAIGKGRERVSLREFDAPSNDHPRQRWHRLRETLVDNQETGPTTVFGANLAISTYSRERRDWNRKADHLRLCADDPSAALDRFEEASRRLLPMMKTPNFMLGSG